MASSEETGFQVFSSLSEDPLTETDSSSKGKLNLNRRIVVTPVGILIYVLITVAIAVGIGLIVHFAHPCNDCKCDCAKAVSPTEAATTAAVEPTDPDDFWQKCVNMSIEREECLPGCTPCATQETETTALPTSPPLPTTGYRLPLTFRPSHYDLELRPDLYVSDPANFRFDGSVDIFLAADNETDVITMNTKQLNITSHDIESLSGGGDISVLDTAFDPYREHFNMSLSRAVTANEEIKVSLTFEGYLLNDLIGLYWSSYEEAGQTKYMAVTQFAATDARKAFPCFDEPAFKATFNITVLRKAGMLAASNTQNYTSEMRGDGWIADKFEKTPIMSTYILVIAVADFAFLERQATGGIVTKEMKYYSRPEAIAAGHMTYAADAGPPLFDFYENYLNYSYALPKLDMMTVPDFSFSAMENWGLVTYKEVVLFVDPEYTSMEERRRTVVVSAHELAHQWFGNTVTCAWFDDVWLNEGLASYFEVFPVQEAEPTWDKRQLFTFDNVYGALKYDCTGRTVPINNPVETPADALNSYSTITYEKAACVTRMVHKLMLGDSIFQTAMQEYIKRHEFSNTNHDDLINIWQEHADNAGLDIDVREMMYTWLKQMGYPVVKLTRDYDSSSDNVHVTQKMFLQIPEIAVIESYKSEYNYNWEVPVSVVTSEDMSDIQTWWLHQDNRTFTTNVASTSWVLGNVHQHGFFRVNYDDDNWNMLINQLESNHWVIDIINRAQLLDDAFHLARAGEMKFTLALRASEYLVDETEWLPWKALKESLPFSHYMLYRLSEYGKYREYIRNLVDGNYQTMGWNDDSGDNITTSFLRTDTIEIACLHEHSDCVDKAQTYFNQWQADPTNMTLIRPDVRFAVYCTVTARGSYLAWDFLFEQYQKDWHGPSGVDRRRIVRALACASKRWLLQRYFEMAATLDERIRTADIITILTEVANNPLGHSVAWDYLNMHWDTVPSRLQVLGVIVRRFSTQFDLEKLELFLGNHPPTTTDEEQAHEDLRQATKANIRFRNDNIDEVIEWLDTVARKG